MDKNDRDERNRDGKNDTTGEWQVYDLQPLANNVTTPYGFVIDHFAYWGIPLAGFPEAPAQKTASDPASAPRTLKVTDIEVDTDKWSGGDFSITATRTPPLFHAYHHKTDEALFAQNMPAFQRRSEGNIVERDYAPARPPLPGRGKDACIQLFDVTFNREGKANSVGRVSDIAFSSFDSRAAIPGAIQEGYFETRRGQWRTENVGPLNALWFVIFSTKGRNSPVNRLEDDYRLWHHRGETGTTHGYDWTIWQKNNFQQLRIEVRLAGELNAGVKDGFDEDVKVTYELEWV